MLNRYIQESEVDLDKSVITEILQDVYREACELSNVYLSVKGFEEDGAFSIENDDGDKVLLMFEEEDDADRYAELISIEDDYPEMSVIEIDDFVAMRACEMHDYMYNIIRPDDIVVPPKNDLFQKDKMA